MKNINWDEAPKGATHYYIVTGVFCNRFGHWLLDEFFKFDDIVNLDGIVFMPKPSKPVFTQAMAAAGESPKSGMECLIKNTRDAHPTFKKGIIKYIGDLVIYSYVKYGEHGERCDPNRNLVFKPIDTRTDKEKAVDDIYRSDLTVKENLAEAYDKWTGK